MCQLLFSPPFTAKKLFCMPLTGEAKVLINTRNNTSLQIIVEKRNKILKSGIT